MSRALTLALYAAICAAILSLLPGCAFTIVNYTDSQCANSSLNCPPVQCLKETK